MYEMTRLEAIATTAADDLFIETSVTQRADMFGSGGEALGAAVGAYLAVHDSRPERLADVITALLAPFGDAMTFETLLLLARQHGGGDGYDFACRLAGQAIAKGGARDMAECVRHYLLAHVAAHVAAELVRQGKPADAMRALATELEAK